MQSSDYKKAIDLLEEAFAAYSVEEISVTAAIDKYLFISDGSNITKFRLDIVPYMIKPIQAAFDSRYKGVIVVAPARSSKTKSLIEGVTFYRAVYQPSDMLLIFATGTKANAYSKKEYDRMVRNTSPMQDITTGKKHDQGIEMRVFKNGSMIEFRSGTNDALSALGYGVVIFTDYDRSPDDGTGSGDSEGSKFDRGLKRTLSEGSNGICIAESSPSVCQAKIRKGLRFTSCHGRQALRAYTILATARCITGNVQIMNTGSWRPSITWSGILRAKSSRIYSVPTANGGFSFTSAKT